MNTQLPQLIPIPATPGGRRFSVMVKPVGPSCNLDCTYCYYLSKESLLGVSGAAPIDDSILEKHIRDYLSGNDAVEVIFDWQGGEPTLLGIPFFEKVIALQQQYTPSNKAVLNNLQTNGTLLDDEWCRFLRKHRFLVGLSIDGPRELHDAYRRDKGGRPTFDRVMTAAKCLKKHGVSFNTLTVLNRHNTRYPLDVYRFLTREVGARMIQLIPVVEPKGFETLAPDQYPPDSMPIVGSSASRPGSADSVVHEWSADPEETGSFLCRIFDEWYNRDIGKYFVNLFETSVASWAGQPAQICVFSEVCGKAALLERDGSLYHCDHYAYPSCRLGNIQDHTLEEMIYSTRQMKFGLAKSDALPPYCISCTYRFACHGECPRNRFIKTPDGTPGLNYFCPTWKRFFAHADKRLSALVRSINSGTGMLRKRS